MKILDSSNRMVSHGDQPALQIEKHSMDTEIVQTLAKEHQVELYLNNTYYTTIICTGEWLVELGLGRLFCDGLLSKSEQVECVRVSEDGSRIDIVIEQEVKKEPDLCPVLSVKWEAEDIFYMAESFEKDTPLHRLTASVHSCHLWQKKTCRFWCEDLGRHNALDKVVGYALIHEIDLRSCGVYISGRVPTDMMSKVIRAGIPLVVSKSLPTQEAVWMAEKYGVTLIGQSKGNKMVQYTGRLT